MDWTNKDNLELATTEIFKALEILGGLDIQSEYSVFYKKQNQKKIHRAYNILFDLNHKLNNRLKKLGGQDEL